MDYLASARLGFLTALSFSLIPWSLWILPLFGHQHRAARRWLTLINEDGSGQILGRCVWWCFASTGRNYPESDAFRNHDGSGSRWKVIDYRK